MEEKAWREQERELKGEYKRGPSVGLADRLNAVQLQCSALKAAFKLDAIPARVSRFTLMSQQRFPRIH